MLDNLNDGLINKGGRRSPVPLLLSGHAKPSIVDDDIDEVTKQCRTMRYLDEVTKRCK
jgi:hypothetical protein